MADNRKYYYLNALTEQGIPVLMTNFSKILNSLSGMFSEDRNKYLASFKEFDTRYRTWCRPRCMGRN